MEKLINDNYKSIVKRGLITPNTSFNDFLDKLDEEVIEFKETILYDFNNRNEELADIILVCLNIAKHYNIDIEKELKRKIKINENR